MITYLKPADARFYLKLSMTANGRPDRKRPSFPFLIVSETDPLALILEAAFVSDAGAKVKPVFLLTQKDEYQLVKDEIYPLTNQDIDRAWQHVFDFLKARNENDAIFLLKDQLGDGGALLPWSPLFFCRHCKEFFQPPCPACGFSLEMSRDDDLLSGLGLQPYSTSLRRYLFCAHCYDTRGESNFYVRELASSDPAILRGRQDLIAGFGQLAQDAKRNANIPCLDCDGFQQCYETGGLATTRIEPISFYPFYMIALPAPTVHFIDLCALLSGANIDELASRLEAENQPGRLKYLTAYGKGISRKTRFFFNKDEKFFLEVLYLKLSLLGELAQRIFSGLNTFKYPDLGLSIDRIWADTPEQGDMLPQYWNFKLRLMGMGLDPDPAPSFSKLPPSYGLYFLGAVWFYVLLVNAKQDVSEVHNEVAKTIDKIDTQDITAPENLLKNFPTAVFSPQNIFWHPDQKTVRDSWSTLWEDSLNLGFLLLRHGMHPLSRWSQTEFLEKFDHLRDTIKDRLFGAEAQAVRPAPAEDTEAIRNILLKITSKWRGDLLTELHTPQEPSEGIPEKGPKIARAAAVFADDLLTRETVILSPENFGEKKRSDDRLEETVLLKPEDVAQPEAPAPASPVEKNLPETVIITHKVPETRETSPKEPRDSDIPETVIISPRKPAPAQKAADQKHAAEADSLEPTKRGVSKGSQKKKPAQMNANDDELPKTMIIKTKKPKNGQ